MKTFLYSLVILAFLGLVALTFKYHTGPIMPQSGNNNISNINLDDTTVEARQLCYMWNTEAGDRAMLSMDLRGADVIGEFYWLPFEKDGKTGIFRGTVTPLDQKSMSRTVNAWWEATSEGETMTEEIKIIFGEGDANVGFGPMKDRGDGVYVYADKENLSYEPSLHQTDCGDEAMD